MSSNENQVNIDTSSQPEENVASLQTINNQFNAVTENSVKLVSNILLSPFTLLISTILILYIYIRENQEMSLFGILNDFVIWVLFIVVISTHLLYQLYGLRVESIIFSVMNLFSNFFNDLGYILTPRNIRLRDLEESRMDITESTNNTMDVNVDEEETNANNNISGGEVFHIPGNHYNYYEAQELCKAYNSRLANYNDIESAYEDGAEWCSYGWSDGQMAFFPTQKDTYNKLQESENEKNNCGRPGVNGGFMANPYLRFGVNCYGVKPNQKERDQLYMQASSVPRYSRNDSNQQNMFSKMIDNIIVSGFNYNKWNQVERI